MKYEEAVILHEKAKEYGSILGLDNIRSLMKELGDVWKKLNIVHIAGTNGKGSLSCYLASVLKEANYKVGQYNSPAVFDLREVYRINNEMISKEDYAKCMELVDHACQRLQFAQKPHPTVFEIETAIAFLWFYQQKCDIVLLEAGMGGSTDATNLIETPLCSVLTSVSMDHMDFLGDTLEKIAKVKSGIIKKGCPVISEKQQPEVERVFKEQARLLGSEYHLVHPVSKVWTEENRLCYTYPKLGTVRLSMLGSYQVFNSALAIETVSVLRRQGYTITNENLQKGLEEARWKGRFECIHTNPLFYIDGAHNLDAVKKLKESLIINFPDRKKIGIMGVMADKEYPAMLEEILPLFETVYTVTPDNKRALSAEVLAEEMQRQNVTASPRESIKRAVYDAVKQAGESENAMIVAFGSLYYLREVEKYLETI